MLHALLLMLLHSTHGGRGSVAWYRMVGMAVLIGTHVLHGTVLQRAGTAEAI